MRLRDFNGFIISSIVLFVIAIAGIIKGNRWLTEPGMPINNSAYLEYFGASVVMLVNGLLSIQVARRAEQSKEQTTAGAAASGELANPR